jgi:hypothetical protein
MPPVDAVMALIAPVSTAHPVHEFALAVSRWQARAEYAAPRRREAAAEPEHMVQAQASYEAEIEL